MLLSTVVSVVILPSCHAERGTGLIYNGKNSPFEKKAKILYVDSYHPEYSWSRSIEDGLFKALGFVRTSDGLPSGPPDIDLKILHMDTKRNTSEEFKIQAGRMARDVIEFWQPDIVICSDDNAAKYLIVPYFMESETPFVFCGINYDASEYGFPSANVTGMVEFHNAVELLSPLKKYARGERIAYLAGDNLSGRKTGESVREQLGFQVDLVYVDSFEEWKEQYRRLQDEADILFMSNLAVFTDWDGNTRALEWFVLEHTRIPTGTWDNSLSSVALITVERTGEEQGEWAGATALRILNGEAEISDIPIAKSKRTAVYLNMMLARRMGIVFPVDLLEIAHLANTLDRVKKVLYVNSYHKGYAWSDSVEKGVLKALGRSDFPIDLQIHRMNTKVSTDPEYLAKQAAEVNALITRWEPDIVIGSDDDFMKYVILPYLKDGEIPVVFCGINREASAYGLPFSNTTGMLEVDPIFETVELLSRFSRGPRLGYLGKSSYYSMAELSQTQSGIDYDLVLLVEDFKEWQEAYLKMQEEVDMLILDTPDNLKGFDSRAAQDFIYENTEIPSGTMLDGDICYTLVGASKIAEEQGWWAGDTALDILGGRTVSDIPMTKNKEILRQLNMILAGKLGIIFSQDLLEESVLWTGNSE